MPYFCRRRPPFSTSEEVIYLTAITLVGGGGGEEREAKKPGGPVAGAEGLVEMQALLRNILGWPYFNATAALAPSHSCLCWHGIPIYAKYMPTSLRERHKGNFHLIFFKPKKNKDKNILRI